jgi:UDP-N-acetylmuramate dehydrogenase
MSAVNNKATDAFTVIENYDLSHANTFGMKVKCRKFVTYNSVQGLCSALAHVSDEHFIHIGAGSNLLFTGDYDGTVLHSEIKSTEIVAETDAEVIVRVGSGITFDNFIAGVCACSLWGVENLSGIPGEVGASAVQNIGAYGVEAKDVIVSVDCIETATRKPVSFSNAECKYAYRDSMFKHCKNRYIVTHVTFRLSKNAAPRLDYGNLSSALEGNVTPEQVRNAVIDIRDKKLPRTTEYGSAGSFFKNPIVDRGTLDKAKAMSQRDDVPFYVVDNMFKIPAAWLIEQCGWKGKTFGDAAVWHLQPLVLVNNGNATANDILTLERSIIQSVKTRFGLTLQPEVEHV